MGSLPRRRRRWLPSSKTRTSLQPRLSLRAKSSTTTSLPRRLLLERRGVLPRMATIQTRGEAQARLTCLPARRVCRELLSAPSLRVRTGAELPSPPPSSLYRRNALRFFFSPLKKKTPKKKKKKKKKK